MKLTIQHTINQQVSIKQSKDSLEPLIFSIDLSISDDHNIIGLYGPSGAGKSTILKIMAGLTPKADYSMHWRNNEYGNRNGHQNPCIYVGEDTQLFDHLSLLDNLKLVQKHSHTHYHSPFTIETVTALCNLSELILKMPWQLSSGEKQRACFARALLTGKKILLLDEAFSALDWTKRMAFNRLLRDVVAQYGYLVIMVSHSLRELSLCVSHLITIDAGKIVEQAKLSDALRNKFASKDAEHEHYFAAITATFSHFDEQDATLQVWNLNNPNHNGEANNDEHFFFVKDPLTHAASNNTDKPKVSTLQKADTQTFIIDANNVSISATASHQTSMVNCLAVEINEVCYVNSGVLICGEWQSQILRSIITIKSYKQLNVQLGDTLYFVFKAL